jgi:hypothetical protein
MPEPHMNRVYIATGTIVGINTAIIGSAIGKRPTHTPEKIFIYRVFMVAYFSANPAHAI